MKISENCLNLIKKFEGLELEAYVDPVGVLTIGYGTIRYPDGRKVRLGDKISEQQAESFLKAECDEVAADVSDSVTVSLNQNQFDALVSFSFNLGVGAFRGSTLLNKLNAGDFDGAANQFPRWNKGTVHGVKTVLPGLTRRRDAEKALFEKVSVGGIPIDTDPSPENSVDLLEGYKDAASGRDVIIASSKGIIVEVIELYSSTKANLIALLQQYPNAKDFSMGKGTAIPVGPRTIFTGTGASIPKDSTWPPFSGTTLIRGSEGSEVKLLQQRLRDLNYYDGDIDGDFGRSTDDAVRRFQADYFSVAGVDGKVGRNTWAKLGGQGLAPPSGPSSAGTSDYLKLTKTTRKDQSGCITLELSYFKAGKFQGHIQAVSGSPNRQFFRTSSNSKSKSHEPLPEGKWGIGRIEWADSKDIYDGKVWNNGLGPAKIRLYFEEGATTHTDRSAIEIHIDWNRNNNPGTAGCVGIYSISDFKQLVTWLRDTDPQFLYVDWSLGTCPVPV